MQLGEFFVKLMDSIRDILLLPIHVVVSAVAFLGLISEFIFQLVKGIWAFVDVLVGLLPNFLKPFFLLIISIRVFKFITKRGNAFHRQAQVSQVDTSWHGRETVSKTTVNNKTVVSRTITASRNLEAKD